MSPSKKSLSKRTRFEVFKRDSFICQYCGNHPPSTVLEVDHINPVANGGDNSIQNLITSCFDCNRGKSDKLLSSVPKPIKKQAEEILEKENQLKGYRKAIEIRQNRIESDAWIIADELMPGTSEKGLRKDWFASIKKFNELLPFDEVLDSAQIAFLKAPRSRVFLYFCGICWRKLREKQ